MVYPKSAKEKGIGGTCIISFIVNADGTKSEILIVKSIAACPECDIEALQAVKKMPNFKPGVKNGKPVRTRYNLPINFRIK